jgi:hypothetical protein
METNTEAPVITRDQILINASVEKIWEIQVMSSPAVCQRKTDPTSRGPAGLAGEPQTHSRRQLALL